MTRRLRRSEPSLGDLLIGKRPALDVFEISTVPKLPSLTEANYQRTLALARRVAARVRVTVWFTNDGTTFVRVADFRGHG